MLVFYYPSSLSASDAAYLQDLASTTVLDSTATWNMFDIQNIDAFGDITTFLLKLVMLMVTFGILVMVMNQQIKILNTLTLILE